jgi:Mg2+ and Co2+ transporter CorA
LEDEDSDPIVGFGFDLSAAEEPSGAELCSLAPADVSDDWAAFEASSSADAAPDAGAQSSTASSMTPDNPRILAQRLNWLDTEIVELRDRSHLLQEEITLKAAEQTNRNLHVLSTVTTIFLPASLAAGIFGMNVAGLPLVQDKSGFLWAMVILVAASVLVYWSLKRWGILRR